MVQKVAPTPIKGWLLFSSMSNWWWDTFVHPTTRSKYTIGGLCWSDENLTVLTVHSMEVRHSGLRLSWRARKRANSRPCGLMVSGAPHRYGGLAGKLTATTALRADGLGDSPPLWRPCGQTHGYHCLAGWWSWGLPTAMAALRANSPPSQPCGLTQTVLAAPQHQDMAWSHSHLYVNQVWGTANQILFT